MFKKIACPDLGDHAFIHKRIELRLEFVMPFLTSPEIIGKLKKEEEDVTKKNRINCIMPVT